METIDQILNSDFFNDTILDIEQENKKLAKAGWSRKDINEMAKFVAKNKCTK